MSLSRERLYPGRLPSANRWKSGPLVPESSTSRRILLVDCDAFFVQVARLEDPEGAGRAECLIVGGSATGRGAEEKDLMKDLITELHDSLPEFAAFQQWLHPRVTKWFGAIDPSGS